jgi:hypothetical protein
MTTSLTVCLEKTDAVRHASCERNASFTATSSLPQPPPPALNTTHNVRRSPLTLTHHMLPTALRQHVPRLLLLRSASATSCTAQR